MKRLIPFFSGYLMAIATMLSCASTNPFPYDYYVAQMPDNCYSQGTLLGKSGSDGWPDLALTTCQPDPQPSPGVSAVPNLDKCTIMQTAAFYAMQGNYEKCQVDLAACQHGPAPTN